MPKELRTIYKIKYGNIKSQINCDCLLGKFSGIVNLQLAP